MSNRVVKSTVGRLADRLTEDIRAKGLGPGDGYMTAAQAGAVFGVSRTTAHRALKLLADKELLVRRRNRGTFVGPHFKPSGTVRLTTTHVLLPSDRVSAWSMNDMVEGIRRVVPGSMVQFGFVPRGDPLAFVKALVEQSRRAGGLFGVIAVSCPREVYRWLDDQHIPTGVIGSVYSDSDRLVSVDSDWRAAGRLLCEHLIGRGHRRLAVLIAERWRPGDNMFLEGVIHSLSAAGLPADALIVRSLPVDPDVASAEMGRLLKPEDRPTGFMCWHPMYHNALRTVSVTLGLASDRDLESVMWGPSSIGSVDTRTTFCGSAVSMAEHAAMVARMMADRIDGKPINDRHMLLPVVLHEAKQPRLS